MVDLRKMEERAARWANILSALPAFYCAYVAWETRHAGGDRMRSYPAFTFCVVAFSLLIGVGAILNFLRRPKSLPLVPSTVVNPWEGHESEAAWREAIALQSHFVDLGRSLDGLFNPLQIDAFRLAERLQVFLKELGPLPPGAPPKVGADEPILSIMQETHKATGPWLNKLAHRFVLDFKGDVMRLGYRFGEIGVRSSEVDAVLQEEYKHHHVEQLPTAIRKMAVDPTLYAIEKE